MMGVKKGLRFISEHQRQYEALSLLDTGRQQGETSPRQRLWHAQMSQDGREQKPSNLQLIYLSLPPWNIHACLLALCFFLPISLELQYLCQIKKRCIVVYGPALSFWYLLCFLLSAFLLQFVLLCFACHIWAGVHSLKSFCFHSCKCLSLRDAVLKRASVLNVAPL